jgi:putative oxidoreductase
VTAAQRATASLLLRLGGGAVFVAFGVGKFASHASEVASFRSYGLPWPAAFVYAIGVIEVVGGALLIVGLATRVAALVLAGDMLGAIVVSGIARGEDISLTLAPAELAAMIFLLRAGPGRAALDRRIRGSGPAAPTRPPADDAYAASAAAGSRRETTFEIPSAPIETP